MKRIAQLRRRLPFLALAASLQITLGYYDPAAQRWINRDPVQETGGVNMLRAFSNRPTGTVDRLGLSPVGECSMLIRVAHFLSSDGNLPHLQQLDVPALPPACIGYVGCGANWLNCKLQQAEIPGMPANDDPWPENPDRELCKLLGICENDTTTSGDDLEKQLTTAIESAKAAAAAKCQSGKCKAIEIKVECGAGLNPAPGVLPDDPRCNSTIKVPCG